MNTWRTLGISMAGGALLVAVACSSTSSGPGGSSDPCGQIFDYLARCTYAGYPASELSRIKPRFTQYCDALVMLPGAVGGSALTTCGQAAESAACNNGNAPPGCETFGMGSLASGSKCVSGLQCQSGSCNISTPIGQDGGTTAPTCGTCDPLIADGQPCGMAPGTCSMQSTCDSMSSKCVALAQGTKAVGATCQGPNECQAMLQCTQASTDGGFSLTCQAASGAGGACPCGSGLMCTMNKCVAPTFAGPGQPCSADGAQCLNGGCDQGSSTSGTCPTTIADGQPCNGNTFTSTCDTFANCVGGTCVLQPTAAQCM